VILRTSLPASSRLTSPSSSATSAAAGTGSAAPAAWRNFSASPL